LQGYNDYGIVNTASGALEEGMRQIKDRSYAKKHEGSGKTVYQAAFAFLGRDDIEMRVE